MGIKRVMIIILISIIVPISYGFITIWFNSANKYNDLIMSGKITDVVYTDKGTQLTFGTDISTFPKDGIVIYVPEHINVYAGETSNFKLTGITIGDLFSLWKNGRGQYKLVLEKHYSGFENK